MPYIKRNMNRSTDSISIDKWFAEKLLPMDKQLTIDNKVACKRDKPTCWLLQFFELKYSAIIQFN